MRKLTDHSIRGGHVSVLVLIALFAHGCNRNGPGVSPVVLIADDDPQMNAAIAKARETLPDFVRALTAPKPSQSGFAVKTPITDGKNTEHMWLNPVRFDGKKYHGTLDSRPEKVSGVKLGSTISIEAKQVTDWMYLEDKKLVGGFTVRVTRDKLSPREREEFDRNAPFVLD